MSGSAALTAEPLPPWLEDVWNTSRLYPSFCVLACWRNESGISSPVSEVKGHGCNAKLHRCPCGELDADRRAPRGDHDRASAQTETFTHAVVLAARFTRSAMVTAMIERHARSTLTYLPANGSSVLIIVDNGSPREVADVLRGACEQHGPSIIYAKNTDWRDGFGYELGAWRWAVRAVLPSLEQQQQPIGSSSELRRRRLADDAIVYLMQDSVALAHAALPYPPPRWFYAASLISYRTEGHGAGIPLIGVPRNMSSAIEADATRAALATVENAPEILTSNKSSATHAPLTRFMSNFGPNLLVTWKTARRLQQRGFFDMLRVRSKLDEQISERVIGYLLTHDKEMRHSACSVGGDISSHLSRCAARRSCNVGAFDKVFLGRGD